MTMGRLFDSGRRSREARESRQSREDIRRRAEEAEEAIKQSLELDEASNQLGAKLAQTQTVRAVEYKAYRERGSKWNIEHAQVGPDYVYQLFPLKPPSMSWKDVIFQFVSAMDAIFPRSIEIRYVPPSERFQLKYYTIRVEAVTSLPGWENATQGRALRSLSAVDAWAPQEPQEPVST